MESNDQSFWKFGDHIRLQSNNFANLSLNDSIWSTNNGFGSKRPEERRNFDIRVGGETHNNSNNSLPVTPRTPNPTTHNSTSDFNVFNDDWKIGLGLNLGTRNSFKPYLNKFYSSNLNMGVKGYKLRNFQSNYSNGKVEEVHQLPNNFNGKKKKKKKEGKKESNRVNTDENFKNSVDRRFKTLPPAEALPKNEAIGGYIFVCNNDTMEENLKRQLFGLPPRFRDSVRAITPGLPIFLYNYSTHQIHGIFEAASFGGSNIDSSAWEDKKHRGESRFPAQVRVQTRKMCEPLDEDEFRPILHHYDGPKFRLALSVPEVLSLLDIFEKDRHDA